MLKVEEVASCGNLDQPDAACFLREGVMRLPRALQKMSASRDVEFIT